MRRHTEASPPALDKKSAIIHKNTNTNKTMQRKQNGAKRNHFPVLESTTSDIFLCRDVVDHEASKSGCGCGCGRPHRGACGTVHWRWQGRARQVSRKKKGQGEKKGKSRIVAPDCFLCCAVHVLCCLFILLLLFFSSLWLFLFCLVRLLFFGQSELKASSRAFQVLNRLDFDKLDQESETTGEEAEELDKQTSASHLEEDMGKSAELEEDAGDNDDDDDDDARTAGESEEFQHDEPKEGRATREIARAIEYVQSVVVVVDVVVVVVVVVVI